MMINKLNGRQVWWLAVTCLGLCALFSTKLTVNQARVFVSESKIGMEPQELSNDMMEDLDIEPRMSRYMTIQKAQGRTGNQIFQYAILICAARRYGYVPYVAADFPLRQYLVIPDYKNITIDNASVFGETGRGIYNAEIERLDTSKNWTFNGFFQSWRYHDLDVLKKEIRFHPEMVNSAKQFMGQVKGTNTASSQLVCVHVRRGDFFNDMYSNAGFAVADLDYINRAMAYFRDKFNGDAKFVVLSNGMDWCKENIQGNDVAYSNFSNPGDDLALMSFCDHVIVTSGTFGWWGALLAGGEVVYFKGYPTPGSPLGLKINATDYYPRHWIGML